MSRPAFTLFAQHYFSALLSNFGTVYLNELVPRDPSLRVYKIPSRSNWGTEVLGVVAGDNPQIMISPEVIAEAELVDVLFEPNEQQARASLGLLGDLLFVPCIIEPLRWIPTTWEIRTCLRHWLQWKIESDRSIIPAHETPVYEEEEEVEYNDEDEEEYEPEPIDKTLLIIVPSIVPEQLEEWGAHPSQRNIPGIYDFPSAFCTTVVVINELPQDSSTLWLRLLGRGQIQRAAIQELMSLEAHYPLRALAMQQLQQWHQLLLDGQMGQESKPLMQLLQQVEFP
jgi:hypothetical protein